MTLYTAILPGDCRQVLSTLPPESIDAVVTDPPYELGFMGKRWDASGVAFDVATWTACLRVLKPGGHLLAFSGTRTYHRMVCAIEDAGFEIRDQLAWLQGQGFPKSKNPGRAIDMERCTLPGRHCESTLPNGNKARPGDHLCPHHPDGDPYRGGGTALSPGHEPIVLARKPLVGTVAANVLAHGTGGLNIDACRIGCSDKAKFTAGVVSSSETILGGGSGLYANRPRPADGNPDGRWPANVLLDEDAAAALDEQSGVLAKRGNRGPSMTETDPISCYGKYGASECGDRFNYDAGGGASRFFYVAKASRSEREAGLAEAGLPIRTGGELTDREDGSDGLKSPRAGAGRGGGRRNHHPTVKPIALMRYLCRLITPPGGVVLDPFAGSGSTGCAAVLEGFHFVGVELGDEYLPIIHARIDAARRGLL